MIYCLYYTPGGVCIKMIQFIDKIRENIPSLELLNEQPLSKFTSFHIGGNAEYIALPKTEEELSMLLKLSNEMDIKPAILGAGTNVLAPDAGIRGLVICLKDCLDGMERIGETSIRVMAGVTMSRAALFAASQGLSGLEFAHGIPGSIGGGVFMNAGAYGGEIKDVCTRVRIADQQGNCRWLDRDEIGFSYRHSAIQDHPWIVVAAEFELEPKPEEEIRSRIKELIGKRTASQPLDKPSAGSAFKRPVGGYASALIDQTGLRGFQVGGAAISEKHTGFVVNLGDATAEDVKSLLKQVSDRVYEHTGIRLEPEVRIW